MFLAFVLVCGLALMPLVWRLDKARQQREAVAEIERLGGLVYYDGWHLDDVDGYLSFTNEPRPTWLRRRLDVELFDDVQSVQFLNGTTIADAELMYLKGLTDLEILDLRRTSITDAGLAHLKGLTNLETLALTSTLISDAGLVHLQGLTNLQWLMLSQTQIGDDGLKHLKGLPTLETLELYGTQVTDAGIAELKDALPRCEIRR